LYMHRGLALVARHGARSIQSSSKCGEGWDVTASACGDERLKKYDGEKFTKKWIRRITRSIVSPELQEARGFVGKEKRKKNKTPGGEL